MSQTKASAAPSGLKRPATFDHLKSKQRLERTVKVYLDQDAVDEYESALRGVETAPTDRKAAADQRLAEAQAKLDETTVTLRFQQIGRKTYDALLREHPPRDNDPDDKDAPYHSETFAPALVAASCVEPKMTEEQVVELFEEWNTSELMDLFMAAMEVNTQRRVVNLGKAFG